MLAVDNNFSSAKETAAMAQQSGGECLAFEADVANETAPRRWSRLQGDVGDASTCSTTMSA